jgi:hypothetical protein
MKHFGAPNSLNISCLAETNGSSTLHKIAACEELPTNLSDPSDAISPPSDNLATKVTTTEMMKQRGVLTEKHQQHCNLATSLAPILEPPSWAVPAQGETRLEVSPSLVLVSTRFLFLMFPSLTFCLL